MDEQHPGGPGPTTGSDLLVETTTGADGTTELVHGGERQVLPAGSVQEARTLVLAQARRLAADAGRPVRLDSRDPEGHWLVTVQPDGRVVADDLAVVTPPAVPSTPAPVAPDQHPAMPPVPSAFPGPAPVAPFPPAARRSSADQPLGTSQPPWPAAASSAPAPRRASFLPDTSTAPVARSGWRGALSRIGIKVQPSAEELRYAEDVAVVSRHWAGPKTIVVANGKGGSSKTPVVIGLSAVFARYGGGGVCAWSNHQMRGTLGWHTVQDPHASTTQDLLAAAPELLATAGKVGDLARFVHHQPTDRFDVLQADPTKTSDKQRFDHHAVDTIHAVLSRFYRVIVMDSDNDESTVHWRRMIDHADQLVVATTTDDVRAETGRLMLEDLRGRGPHAARLAEEAVVVVSQAHQDEPPAAQVARKFTDYGLPVATIPYDAGMKRLKISYDGLSPATQRAYLTAAALVARSLHD